MSTMRCSFCKRPKNEVKSLIAANPEDGPFICNRCVETAIKEIEAGAKKGNFEQKQKEETLKVPKEIKAHLDEYVIAQDEAKRVIATAVYNHFKRRKAKESKIEIDVDGHKEEVEIEKENILLLGPSGTGKTHIARTIARLLNVPFHVGDATRLTQAGYVGDDVETLLQGLVQDAHGDVERAQWGIIFIDEIDKIARKGGRDLPGYRDVTGEGVQQALLKLLEGSKINVPRAGGKSGMMTTYDTVDTQNILFICSGSFAGIEPLIEKRLNKGSRLGFGAATREKIDQSKAYLSATEEDILDFGFIIELMGRLQVITTTVELSEDDMIRVLTEPRNSVIKQARALFQLDNIHLDFEPEAIRAIAREAKKRPTGARALKSIVAQTLKKLAYDLPGDSRVSRVLVTEKTVETGVATLTMAEEAESTDAKQA